MGVVVNNTVLSNFAKVQKLNLLVKTLRIIYITQEVLNEYNEGVKKNKLPPLTINVKIIRLNEEEKQLCDFLSTKLGLGEASSIAVAVKRKLKLLTDDLDARKIAKRLGVPVSGTIGVLALAVKKHYISLKEGNDILRNMISHGFFSPIKKLEEVLQ